MFFARRTGIKAARSEAHLDNCIPENAAESARQTRQNRRFPDMTTDSTRKGRDDNLHADGKEPLHGIPDDERRFAA